MSHDRPPDAGGDPIGNLSDLSPRAVDALRECDFIAAEDTRVTLRLLNYFGIRKPLISYFEHNKRERGEAICARLLQGETAALVTDAGMPAISDPGQELVALCYENHIPVGVVPGPTAVITALALAGLPTGRFAFEGFLSVDKRQRREHLDSLKRDPAPWCFTRRPISWPPPCGICWPRWGTAPGPWPGIDQAPRGGAAHHAGGGCGPVRGGNAPGRIRPGGGRRGTRGAAVSPRSRPPSWPGVPGGRPVRAGSGQARGPGNRVKKGDIYRLIVK